MRSRLDLSATAPNRSENKSYTRRIVGVGPVRDPYRSDSPSDRGLRRAPRTSRRDFNDATPLADHSPDYSKRRGAIHGEGEPKVVGNRRPAQADWTLDGKLLGHENPRLWCELGRGAVLL